MTSRWLSVVLLLASAVALGSGLSFQEHAAVQESLSRVHPRVRASWLREHGLDDSYYTTFQRPESTGLKCVGRWPWGPSWELAGRDTFLYLGSGSGVRILSIADSVQPRMLGQINARSLVSQIVVQDSLLFVACGSWGAQVYSVSDPASPRELGSMDAVIGDLCVKDTFCYAAGGDSLRIYNVATPAQPVQLGAIRDSGDLVVVANGYAFTAGRWVMNIYNVTDPAHPTWANSRGGPCYAMFVRRNLLFCSSVQPDNMTVLSISNPLNITQVSKVDGYGGEGLYVDDSYAYLSCTYEHHGLFVIDVSDSSRPVMHDSINPEGVEELEPYVPRPNSYGYLADHYGGLVTLDLHDANSISQAWAGCQAHEAVDVVVDGQRAYVANQCAGLQILDVSDPREPVWLGRFDTLGSKQTRTATARDSFAFSGMSGITGRRFLRVLNVLDPANPTLVAQESCFNPPEDYVLGDSLLYLAEANQFQVFNVARPREPVRVGSCGLSSYATDLHLVDTLAFMSGLPLTIVSVAQPGNPRVLSTWNRGVAGLDVVDTVLYAVGQNARFWTLSVANPASPRPLDSVTLPSYDGEDVVVIGSTAYASENVIRILDVSDPSNLRIVGQANVPYWTPRLVYAEPYLYACCAEGGICVLETVPPGIAEQRRVTGGGSCLTVAPSIATGRLVLKGRELRAGGRLAVFDITGKEVLRLIMPAQQGEASGRWPVDLSRLSAGVYVLRLEENGVTEVGKVVINRR
jgi:hypothetical protein